MEGKTPFEAWTGQKPNVGRLRVFGCAAYAHVAKDERQKLDAKSRNCVLLGYGTERKGYLLYHPRCKRLFYSRDVVFVESSHKNEKEQSVPERSSERYVEWDFHDDEKRVADKEHNTEEGAEPVVQRSNWEKKVPDYYGDWTTVANAEVTEQTTVKDALNSLDKAKWMSAMEKEIDSLRKNVVQLVSDPYIYVASEGEMFMIAIHKRIGDVEKALFDKFEVKDMGELHHFLRTKVLRNKQNGDVWIGQQAYTQKVLCKFNMENAKVVDTPVDASSKLVKMNEDSESTYREQFQSAVGSRLYLSTMTRPDITYAVSNVAKFRANPTKEHWIAVKRIMRCLVETMYLGLLYKKNELTSFVGFSDADWT